MKFADESKKVALTIVKEITVGRDDEAKKLFESLSIQSRVEAWILLTTSPEMLPVETRRRMTKTLGKLALEAVTASRSRSSTGA